MLMLEPLFRCNLACAGCGKIQYPAHILRKELTPEQCFAAADECGAPIVSIPGGEPLMQHKFALKLFAAARAMAIHTALDTAGYLGDRLTDADLETIDLVLLDIKSWDGERHRHLTGADIGPVLSFARRLAARNRPVWLRFVLVPGLTDNPEDIERIASFAGELGNVQRVDVLPFHQMGMHKWKKLGIEYKLQNVEPPSTELVDLVCSQFRAAGLAAY